MRLALPFAIIVLLALGAYIFLPRTSSLTAFDAEQIASLNAGLWRDEAGKKDTQTLLDQYRILNGQYGIAPIPSASAALALLQAHRTFSEAADQPDEEKALPFLEEFYSTIARQTGTNIDPAILAKLELVSWSLARDRSKERQLTDAISEKLALLHGGTAKDFQPPAADFARAKRLAYAKNWNSAGEAESSAWKKLRRALDARSANPNH